MPSFEQTFHETFVDSSNSQKKLFAVAAKMDWMQLLTFPTIEGDANKFITELMKIIDKGSGQTPTQDAFVALQVLLDFPLSERSSKKTLDALSGKQKAEQPQETATSSSTSTNRQNHGTTFEDLGDNIEASNSDPDGQPAIGHQQVSSETCDGLRELLLRVLLKPAARDVLLPGQQEKFEALMTRPVLSPLPKSYTCDKDYDHQNKEQENDGENNNNNVTADEMTQKATALKPLDEKIRENASKAIARMTSIDFSVLKGNHAQDPRAIKWMSRFAELVRQVTEIAESLPTIDEVQTTKNLKVLQARHILLLFWRCPGVLVSPAFEDLVERFIECIKACYTKVPKLRGPATCALSTALLGLELEERASKYRQSLASVVLDAVEHSNKELGDNNQISVICESSAVSMDELSFADELFKELGTGFGRVFQTFTDIVKNKSFFYSTRKYAAGVLQFTLQNTEETGNFFKTKTGKNMVLPLFLQFTELLEEIHEFSPSLTYLHDYQSYSMASIISIVIDRLVGANLNHKALREAVPQFILQNLNDKENWRKRVAGIQAATYVVEHFVVEFGAMLPVFMDRFAIPMIQNDPHWLVRLALFDLVAQFSRDLPGRVFLEPYAKKIVTVLASVLNIADPSASDDAVKKKVCNDACCIRRIAITIDGLIDGLDDFLADAPSDSDDDDDNEGNNDEGNIDKDDDDDDEEELEFEDCSSDEDEDEEDDEEDEEEEESTKQKSSSKKQPAKRLSRASRIKKDLAFRKSFSSFIDIILPSCTSQIKKNVLEISKISPEKEEMMTMERTVSTSEASAAATELDSLNDLPREKQTLIFVEDQLMCALLNPISSLANLMARSFPPNHVDKFAELCLPLLDRLEDFPPGKVEFPFQALETISVVAHFLKRKDFPQKYTDAIFAFVNKIVQNSTATATTATNAESNSNDELDTDENTTSKPFKVSNFLANSSHFIPYVLRALNCLTRHLKQEMAPHLKTVIPFLIKIGSDLPVPTVTRYEPGLAVPESDERYTYFLSVGENDVEYVVRYDRAQWENIKTCSVSLWSMLDVKPLQPHLAPYARQLVSLFSKLLETKSDDLVSDTATAVASLANVLPHLKNIQARQYLAYSILKPLIFAVNSCDDAEVASCAVTASKKVVPYLRDWDDQNWNFENLRDYCNMLHRSIQLVIKIHTQRVQAHQIREQIRQQRGGKSKKSSLNKQKRVRRSAKQEASSSDDDDEDELTAQLFEDCDEDLCDGVLSVAFESVESFVVLCKKYPKLTSSFASGTWQIHKQIFDVTGPGPNYSFLDAERKGSSKVFYDEAHENCIYFGFLLMICLFEMNVDNDDILLRAAPEVSKICMQRLAVASDKPTVQTLSFGLRMLCECIGREKNRLLAKEMEVRVTEKEEKPKEEEEKEKQQEQEQEQTSSSSTKDQQQTNKQILSTFESDHFPHWITFIRTFLDNKRAKSSTWLEATANILMFQVRLIPLIENETQRKKLFRSMIPHLPAREDEHEAKILHEVLVQWLNDENNELLGRGNPEAREEDREAVLNALRPTKKKGLSNSKVQLNAATKEMLKNTV